MSAEDPTRPSLAIIGTPTLTLPYQNERNWRGQHFPAEIHPTDYALYYLMKRWPRYDTAEKDLNRITLPSDVVQATVEQINSALLLGDYYF